MKTRLNPYLGFKDNAREVMEFYKSVFGGELTLSTFGESGASDSPALADRIMHAQLEAGDHILLMASDAFSEQDSPVANGGISLSGDNEEELTGFYNKLAEGGTVLEPLTRAPWGDTFGMCIDKFGVRWLVNIAVAQQ